MNNFLQWLPLDIATKQFRYAHKESFSRRLRQLRRQGFVADIGNPPKLYFNKKEIENASIVLFWPNPKTALLRQDASPELLKASRGKRIRNNLRTFSKSA